MGWLIFGIIIGWVMVGVIIGTFLGWLGFGIFGAITIVVLFKKIIQRVPYSKTWIIDHNGTAIEKHPGYRIIIPFFGYDKLIKSVTTERQYGIILFSDVEKPWIDLSNGGEITLHDPQIWIIIHDPLKAVTTAVEFEEQLREMAENRVTGAINVLDYEQVVTLRFPKGLFDKEEGEGKEETKKEVTHKLDEIISESKSIKDFLESIGAEYKGFTLDDFDFDKDTQTKRRERILAEMEKSIAEDRGKARKNEILTIGESAKELEEAGFDPKDAQKTASERYQDHLVAEKGKLQKIIWQGGESTLPGIAAMWESGKKLLPGDKPGTGEKPKGESEENPEGEKENPEEEKTKPVQGFWKDKRPMERIHRRGR
ncbi:MAG: hypothetical protein ABH831_02300 [Candidatus Nealsonbacteria bacterium]